MKKLLKDCLYIIFIVTVMFFVTNQPSFSKTIKFAQVSDVHLSTVREDNNYKLLSKTRPLLIDAIEQINKEPNVNFVVFTGDGIDRPNKSSLDKFLEEINKLHCPWYYALGNHDTTPDGYLTKANFLKILNENNSYHNYENTYYSLKPQKGFKIIVLDGVKNQGISSNGFIPQEELKWLDTTLAKSKRDVVLIFIHFPVYPTFDSPGHEILNANELKAILNKYKMPIAIFSGHYHMTKIFKRGNLIHISTPSLAGYPNSFRIIEINNSRKQVTFNFKYMETNLKDLQTKTKIMTFGGALYYGREADRNTTITIKKEQ